MKSSANNPIPKNIRSIEKVPTWSGLRKKRGHGRLIPSSSRARITIAVPRPVRITPETARMYDTLIGTIGSMQFKLTIGKYPNKRYVI